MAAGGVGEMEEEESAEDLTPVVKVLDVMRKSEKKGPNFLGQDGPILRLTFSESF